MSPVGMVNSLDLHAHTPPTLEPTPYTSHNDHAAGTTRVNDDQGPAVAEPDHPRRRAGPSRRPGWLTAYERFAAGGRRDVGPLPREDEVLGDSVGSVGQLHGRPGPSVRRRCLRKGAPMGTNWKTHHTRRLAGARPLLRWADRQGPSRVRRQGLASGFGRHGGDRQRLHRVRRGPGNAEGAPDRCRVSELQARRNHRP
jgi:hypothetical protein